MEPIIHDDEISASGGGVNPGGAVAGYPGRRDGGQQQGLIADLGRVMDIGIDFEWPRHPAAISPAQIMNLAPAPDQILAQAQGHGSLSGTAGNKIPDAKHRNAGLYRVGKEPPQPPPKTIAPRQRHQHPAQRSIILLPEVRRAHVEESP